MHKKAPKKVASTRAKAGPPRVSFPAIAVSYNNVTYYVTVLKARELFALSYVSRADEDAKAGFQRALGPGRAKRIAEYLDEGNVIPGALILSAKPEAEIEYSAGVLSFTPSPKSFLVLDGQHRLFGASAAKGDVFLPACVFTGLTASEEVQYFLDVNGEQRGVPRTLRLEIVKLLDDVTQADKERLEIFRALNERPDSPLSNKLSPTKSVVGKLSHVPFEAAIKPLLGSEPLNRLGLEQKIKLIISFLSAAEQVLHDVEGAPALTKAAFFQALLGAFKDATGACYQKHRNYKLESLLDILEPIARINWSSYSGTNKQVVRLLSEEIARCVSDGSPIPDNLL